MKLSSYDLETSDMLSAIGKMREAALERVKSIETLLTEREELSPQELSQVATDLYRIMNITAQLRVWAGWRSIFAEVIGKSPEPTMAEVSTRLTAGMLQRSIMLPEKQDTPVGLLFSQLIGAHTAVAIQTCNMLEMADAHSHELADEIGPDVYDRLRSGDKEAQRQVSRLSIIKAAQRCAELGKPFPPLDPQIVADLGLTPEDLPAGALPIPSAAPPASDAEHAAVFA